MQEDFSAYFLAFRAVLSRERVVFSGYISDVFIRFDSRVGQVVGQRKVEAISRARFGRDLRGGLRGQNLGRRKQREGEGVLDTRTKG